MGTLIAGILAGAVGAGYMLYGRRTARYAPFGAGLLLCVLPYFIDDWRWLCVIAGVLLVVPFVTDA